MLKEMTKEERTLFLTLCYRVYIAHSAADMMWFVTEYNGQLIAIIFDRCVPADWIGITRTSDGTEYKARVKPALSKIAVARETHDVSVLGWVDEITAEFRAHWARIYPDEVCAKNAGWVAEYAVYRAFGRASEWRRDNVPFFEGGDIEVEGVKIQIKTYGAEFLRETALRRLQ